MRFEISDRHLARVIFLSGSLALGFLESRAAAAADIVDRLQERYRTIKGYTAQFTEETQLPGAGAPLIKKGVVQILIPSKMRWDYTDPDKSDMIVDGARLWLVHSKRDEAIFWDFQGGAEVPLGYSFLMGVGDLKKSFEIPDTLALVKPPVPESCFFVIPLRPKVPVAQAKNLVLEVYDDPPRIRGIQFVGAMGESARIRFEGFAEAKDFPEGTFAYKPGPKTRVRDARELLSAPPSPVP